MTTLEHVAIIARKEAREIITNRGLAVSGVFFATWFSIMAGLGITEENITQQVQLNNSLFYMGALIGLFVGYIYSGQTYLREKQSGIVETLLCSPVSLRSIWIGKALGVAVPSTVLSLLAATAITIIAGYLSAHTLMPSVTVLVRRLIVVPICICAAVALMGFAQLMLGMRENMVVNMLTIMLLFGALAAARLIVERAELVTWTAVGALAGASMALLALTWALGGLLSRERIVKTIS